MSSFRALLQVTISLSLLATSAQAQLEFCFDDQVAYHDEPGIDWPNGLSWVTDYRSPENGGYHTGGRLETMVSWPGFVGVIEQAALVDVHGVTGWRVPTIAEYLTIFPYSGDCGALAEPEFQCTQTSSGWSNPPWWNAKGAHLHTVNCSDGTLAPCLEGSHFAVHGETYDSEVQGEAHTIAFYSQQTTFLVQTGNVCAAAAVPSSGLAGKAVLAAVLMGLAALLLSATVLKHGKFKHG